MGTFKSHTKLLSTFFNTYQVDLKETLHMGGHSEKGPCCSFMKLQTSCSLLNAFCCVQLGLQSVSQSLCYHILSF